MTATAHALVGGAFAAAFPNNPVLGITLSTISHPILDIIPHWDFGMGWRKKNKITLFIESSLDLIIGIILAFFLFGKFVDPIYFLTCIFFSEIWDILMMPYLLMKWNFPPFSTSYNLQHKIQSNIKLPWGILTQAATVYGVVWALRFVH